MTNRVNLPSRDVLSKVSTENSERSLLATADPAAEQAQGSTTQKGENSAFDDLQTKSFDLIVADPPWPFKGYTDVSSSKSCGSKYKLMSANEILNLPVEELARPNCLLLLWASGPQLPLCIEAVRRWGFEYKSDLVWRKLHRSGKPAVGTGWRVRNMQELVLVATKGRPKHKALPGIFDGTRREHSRKPDEFYSLVTERCADLVCRADLFARQSRPGFSAWGDEVGKFD